MAASLATLQLVDADETVCVSDGQLRTIPSEGQRRFVSPCRFIQNDRWLRRQAPDPQSLGRCSPAGMPVGNILSVRAHPDTVKGRIPICGQGGNSLSVVIRETVNSKFPVPVQGHIVLIVGIES